jgi:hypothetical protein
MNEKEPAKNQGEDAGAAIPETLKELEELRIDARLGKDKHFSAAERTKNFNVIFGLPVIVINVLLGSIFFTELISEGVRETIGPILAFLAAALGAIHTFFNFHKSMEGHRSVGNRYIEVSRRCRTLIRGFYDGHVSRPELWKELNKLLILYNSINAEAEAFPTNRRDFERARQKKEEREQATGEGKLPPNPTAAPDQPRALRSGGR